MNERGFTIIELLVVIVIVGTLGGLAMSQFAVYKADAQYTKAQSSLRDMRTSFQAAEQEEIIEGAGAGDSLTGTSTVNAPLAGNLATLFPGIQPSSEVKIHAQWFPRRCEGSNGTQLEQFFKATSCEAKMATSYARHCDGTEINLSRQAETC